MRAYYYLLFRLYNFFDKREKQNVLFNVTVASTIIIYVGLFTIYIFLEYLDILVIFQNKYFVIPIMVGLSLINYYVFVRHKYFLTNHLRSGLKNDLFLITCVLLIIGSYIIIANKNRAKLEEQRLPNAKLEKVEKPHSLEGKIRKWITDK
jgi:hypothetical protein